MALIRGGLLERSERGVEKYGSTLARTDLDIATWLRQLFEKLSDAVLYTRRLMFDIEGRSIATEAVTAAPRLEIELIEEARPEAERNG